MPVDPRAARAASQARRAAEAGAAAPRTDFDQLLSEQRSAAFPQIEGIFRKLEDNPTALGTFDLSSGGLTPEEAEAFRRMQTAQPITADLSLINETDEGVLAQIAEASKAGLIEQFGNHMRLDDDTILAILQTSGALTLDELYAMLASTNLQIVKKELAPRWQHMTPHQQAVFFDELPKGEQELLENAGVVPPGSGVKDQMLAWGMYGLNRAMEAPLIGRALRWVEARERDVSQVMAGASESNDLGMFDAVRDGPDGQGTSFLSRNVMRFNPLTHAAEAAGKIMGDEQVVEDARIAEQGMAGVIDEFAATIGAAALATVGGRWSHYWRTGAEVSGEDQFIPSKVDEVMDFHGVTDSQTIQTILGVSAKGESGAVNKALEDDPEALRGIYEQALQTYLEEEMPGLGDEEVQARSAVYGAFVENQTAFEAFVELNSRGRVSYGRNAAIRAGLEPGDRGYNAVSGSGDAVKAFVFDPFIVVGKAAKSMRAARWGIQNVEGAHRAGRIAKMMDRPAFQRFADDFMIGIREQLQAELNTFVRNTDPGRLENMTVEEIVDEIAKVGHGMAADRNFGIERIARNHPGMLENARTVLSSVRGDVVRDYLRATSHGTVDAQNAVGKVNRVRIVDNEAVTEVVDSVEIMKRADDGTWELTEDLVGADTLRHWILREDGLSEIAHGRGGGVLMNVPMLPHDSWVHALPKGGKRWGALAIDWLNDSHTTVGRKLLDGGYIDEDTFNALGLGITQSARRMGTLGKVQNEIIENTETLGDLAKGTGLNLLRAAAASRLNPLTSFGRLAHSMTSLSHNGPIQLGSGQGDVFMRNYLSMVPSDMRSRMFSQWMAATTDGDKLRVGRSIISEIMNRSGITSHRKGKEFYDEVMDRWDSMHGYANITDDPTRSLDWMHDASTRGGRNAALDTNDLAGAMYLPDVRQFYRVISLTDGWKRVGAPLDYLFGSGVADWFHGQMWNRFTLMKPAFSFRASFDELGVAMVREGVLPLMASRGAFNLASEGRIIPRFLRPDHFLLRRYIKNSQHYSMENILRRVGDDLPIKEGQIDEYAGLLRKLDDIYNSKGATREKLIKQFNESTSDSQRAIAASLTQQIKRYMSTENPRKIMARVQAESSSQTVQAILAAGRAGDQASKWAKQLMRWMTPQEMEWDVYRMLHLSGDADRFSQKLVDMQAAGQHMMWQNPSANAQGAFNIGASTRDPINPSVRLVIDSVQRDLRDVPGGTFDMIQPHFIESLIGNWQHKFDGAIGKAVVEEVTQISRDLTARRMSYEEFSNELRARVRQRFDDPEIRGQLHRFERHGTMPDGRPVRPVSYIEMAKRLRGTGRGDDINHGIARRFPDDPSDGGPPQGPTPQGPPPDGGRPPSSPSLLDAPRFESGRGGLPTVRPRVLASETDRAYSSIVQEQIDRLDVQIEQLDETLTLAGDDAADGMADRLEQLRRIRSYYEAGLSEEALAPRVVRSVALARGISAEVWDQMGQAVLDPRNRDHLFRLMFGNVQSRLNRLVGREHTGNILTAMEVFDPITGEVDPIGLLRYFDVDTTTVRDPWRTGLFDNVEPGDLTGDIDVGEVIQRYIDDNADAIRLSILDEAEARRADLEAIGADPESVTLFEERLVQPDEDLGALLTGDIISAWIPGKHTIGGLDLSDPDRGYLLDSIVQTEIDHIVPGRPTGSTLVEHLTDVFPDEPGPAWRTIVDRNGDATPAFQSLLTPGNVTALRRAWSLAMHHLDNPNTVALGVNRRWVHRLNEVLGNDPDEFVVTPLHVEFLFGMLEETGSNASGLNQLIDSANRLGISDDMLVRSFAVRDIARASTGRLTDAEAFQHATKAEGLVMWSARQARDVRDQGAVLDSMRATKAHLDEVLHGARLPTDDALFDALDGLSAQEYNDVVASMYRQLSGEGSQYGVFVSKANDVWDEIRNDEEFVDALRELSPPHDLRPYARTQVTPIDLFDEWLPAPMSEEARNHVVGAFVSLVGGDDVDLLRVDTSDLLAVLADLRSKGDLSDVDYEISARVLNNLSEAAKFVDMANEGLPPDIPGIMARMLERVNMDGGVDTTPEYLWLLSKYVDFKSSQLADENDWRAFIGGIEGAEQGIYGRWTSKPTSREVDELGDELASAAYTDQGPPSGPPPVGPPPPRGDDYDDSGSLEWMADNVFASTEEAVADHVDKVVRAFEEQFMADPRGVADELAAGNLAPTEGHTYAKVVVDRDGDIESVTRLRPDELKDEMPGIVMAEVPEDLDVDGLVGVNLSDLADRGVQHYGKPITTDDWSRAEQDVHTALEVLRAESELAGFGSDIVKDPLTLNGLVAALEKVKRDDPDKWRVMLDRVLATMPSERGRRALSKIVEGGGVDPHAIHRTISDDLLERMLQRHDAGLPVASLEDIDGTVVRPRMLPKETYSGKLRRQEPGGSGSWLKDTGAQFNEALNRVWEKGFGEILLPWVDTLSRNPMISHYYTEGAQFIRAKIRDRHITTAARDPLFHDQIKTIKGAIADDASAAAWDAKALEVSESLDRAGYPVTEELKREIGILRMNQKGAVDADGNPYQVGPLARVSVPSDLQPEVRRLLQDADVDVWVQQLFDEADDDLTDALLRAIDRFYDPRKIDEVNQRTVGEILDRALGASHDIERRIDGRAKTYAYSKMTAFTDMDSTGSLFAMKFRNLFPFWWAEERFLKRITQSVVSSPERFRTAQLTYKGIDSYGFIEEDEDGEKIFVYPFGAMMNNGLAKIMSVMTGNPEAWKVPGIERTTGRFLWAAPGLDTQGIPQPGPIAAIKLHLLADRFPELEPVRRGLLPEIAQDPNRTAFEFVAPSTVRKFLDIPNSHERYASQMFAAAAVLLAADQVPWDTSDPNVVPTTDELELFNARLENYTRIFAIENAAYGLVGLAPPSIEIPDTVKQEELRDLMTLLGWEDALPEFARRNPDIDPVAMFSTESASGGPLLAVESVGRQIDEHHDWFSSDLGRKTATFFVKPEASDTELSNRVFSQMMDMGLRHNRSDFAGPDGIIDEVTRELRFQRAAPTYFQMRSAYDTMRDEVKGTPLAPDLDSEWNEWQESFFAQNPTFREVLFSKVDDPRTELERLEEALAHPNSPSNEKTESIAFLVENWRKVRDQIEELGGYHGRTEPKAAIDNLRARFIEWGYQQVVDDPSNLSYVWERLILPELGYTREEAMEKAGIQTVSEMVSPNIGGTP